MPYQTDNQKVQNERKSTGQHESRFKRDLNLFDDSLVPDQDGKWWRRFTKRHLSNGRFSPLEERRHSYRWE